MNAPTHEAAELRAKAADCYKREQESFERSDTDGFLSQWASSITARKYLAEADLIDAGGTVETRALFNLDGTVASTHNGWNNFGEYWVLNEAAAARYGKRFFNPSKAQDQAKAYNADKRKGFTVGTVKVRGYVDIVGSGRGLSGAASATVATLPVVEDLKQGRYEIVCADSSYGSDPCYCHVVLAGRVADCVFHTPERFTKGKS